MSSSKNWMILALLAAGFAAAATVASAQSSQTGQDKPAQSQPGGQQPADPTKSGSSLAMPGGPANAEELAAVKAFQEKPVDPARLDTVRKRLRYQVALSMDNSDTIAQILSYYVALKRTPETMNTLYDQYAKLTSEDVQ